MQKLKAMLTSAFLFQIRQYTENEIFRNFMFLKLKVSKIFIGVSS